MSAPCHIQGPVDDAAQTHLAPDTTHTRPVASRKEPRSFLVVCLGGASILVAIEWILFIAAFSVNLKLSNRYFSYGGPGVPRPYDVDYPPFVVKSGTGEIDIFLILCVVPLGSDTVSLLAILCWTCCDRLRRVLVLCVSVVGFLTWSICGCFNVMMILNGRESRWDAAFNSLYRFFTAVQFVLGVVWLMILIAVARSIDKRKKNKWMAEGVARASRRQLGEEHQLQDLPAYRA